MTDVLPRTYPVHDLTTAEIAKRFTYHRPQPDQLPRYERLRNQARELAQLIVLYTPSGREQALALTKLEEAVMHANSAIAREAPVVPAQDESTKAPTPAEKLAPIGG